MDIRNWPIDRIMQLPDCCFGRRWPISVSMEQATKATYYDISEAGMPERCVIWSFVPWMSGYTAEFVDVSLALGDVLPANDAEFDANEVLFRDIGVIAGGRRRVTLSHNPGPLVLPLRLPIEATGRRLIGRFVWTATGGATILVILVISSIPTEVPDWLSLEKGSYR